MPHPSHLGFAAPPGLGFLDPVFRPDTLGSGVRIQGYRVWRPGSQLPGLASRLKALESGVEKGPEALRSDTLQSYPLKFGLDKFK
jgi:hypothetical protein